MKTPTPKWENAPEINGNYKTTAGGRFCEYLANYLFIFFKEKYGGKYLDSKGKKRQEK